MKSPYHSCRGAGYQRKKMDLTIVEIECPICGVEIEVDAPMYFSKKELEQQCSACKQFFYLDVLLMPRIYDV